MLRNFLNSVLNLSLQRCTVSTSVERTSRTNVKLEFKVKVLQSGTGTSGLLRKI